MPYSPRYRLASLAAALSGLVLTAACGGGSSDSSTTSGSSTKAAAPTQSVDTSLGSLLPAKIKAAGTIKVATDASYAPNEFFDKDNKTIIGMDVDLGKAIGQVLGVKAQFVNSSFDGIIPALGTRYDLGMSSFTDNKKREQTVDMVTYFSAGTSFLVKKGTSGVNGLDDLCGKSVGVEKGTTQLDDATAQGKKCTAAGKPAAKVLPFPDQNGANLALQSGRVMVVMADSPVNAYAAKQSGGAFTIVGSVYGTAPYGIAVPKTGAYAGFSKAVLAAMQKLVDNGTYKTVLAKWGVSEGAITKPVINGATS